MKKQPLVSIIIPAYNAANYVCEAIDSALAQTYSEIEIIVVDDGSTDNTKEIIAPYLKKEQIKYVYQENKGLSGARNTGIRNSKGEFIALLDTDDVFLPDKLERIIKFFDTHRSSDICYTDVYHFWDENPGQMFKLGYHYYSGEDVLRNLIKGLYFIAPSATVFRRSVFDRFGYFDENLKRSEDLEFFVRVTYRGCKISFVPEILGKIRLKTQGGLQDFRSQATRKVIALNVYEKLYDQMDHRSRRDYRMAYYLAVHRLRAGIAFLSGGDRKRSREFILKSFSNYSFGAVLGWLIWVAMFFVPTGLWKLWIRRYLNHRIFRALKKV